MPSEEELIDALQEVADELGRAPSIRQFHEMQDEFKYYHCEKVFGSWLSAREAAGLEFIRTSETNEDGKVKKLTKRKNKYSDEELLEDLKRANEKTELAIKSYEYDEIGEYCSATFKQRFGSWPEALLEIGDRATYLDNVWVKEDNPNWGGGVKTPYGKNWANIREEILQRDDYECHVCKMSRNEHRDKYDRDLHVHHIQPRRVFESVDDANTEDNLVTLCFACHHKWEGVCLIPERE